jgi:hypothetical protein
MTPEEVEYINSQRPGWWEQRRTIFDTIRCHLGRHRSALRATNDSELIERCSCGAIRFEGRFWLRDKTCKLGPRRPSRR